MSNNEAPYDPYIPSGQSAPQQNAGGNTRTQALQAVSLPVMSNEGPCRHCRSDLYTVVECGDGCSDIQIDDTVGVMRDNINKVSQRGERLDALQDKTDNLAVSAQGFRRGANRVRKQMWWKDMKMRMCLIAGIVILLIIIIVPAVVATR